MNVVEKIAYTKGFFSGLNIDDNTKEGKAFHALLNLFEELVVSNADLEQQCARLKSQVSEIDEHVAEVFNNVFDNASYDLGHKRFQSTDLFEVVCSECGTRTSFGQSVALQGRMDCPGCGIILEFDYDDTPTERPVSAGTASPVSQSTTRKPLFSSELKSVLDDPVVRAERKEESFRSATLPGVTFSTAPPLPKSEGEKDRIPQTLDFVYSESTEDDERSAEIETKTTESVAETPPMEVKIPDMASESPELLPAEEAIETIKTEDHPDAETKSQPEISAGETHDEESPAEESEEKEPEVRSALVKVDFVADPEAFEAGKKKGTEYKFSTDNVMLDFAEMIPEVSETSNAPDA